MSKLINKIQIGHYQINQPFLHQIEEFEHVEQENNRYAMHLYFTTEHKYHAYIEYILITFEQDPIPENIFVVIQANGYDLWERLEYIYYNKIFPLQCENLYDVETNNLLHNMVRSNDPELKKVLFIPFRTAKNGWLLDVSPKLSNDQIPSNKIDTLLIRLCGLSKDNFNIYMKVSDQNSQNIDKLGYSHI